MAVERRRSILATCCGVHALHDGLVDMLYAVLPVLAEAFGLSYAQVGMIRAANKTATALFQIPAGLLSERVGARVLLVLGTAVAGLAFLGLGASEGFAALLVLFFLAGCGAAVQHPLSSSLITEAFVGPGRRSALGTYNTFGDIGKFAFMGGAILAIGAGLSWSVPMYTYGVLALMVALVAWGLLQATGAGAAPQREAGGGPALALGGGWGIGSWGIKNRVGFGALAGIATLDAATRSGFLTFVAFVMIEKGVDTEWAALSVLVALFGGMCGKFACGLLAERIGIVRSIALTEVATAVGIVLVVVLPGYTAFAVLPFLGIVLNGTSSVIYGTVGELFADERHSRAFGLVYTLGSACGIVAPLAYGVLGDLAGIGPTLLVIGVTVLLTLPLCAVLAPALQAPDPHAV